MKNHESEIHAVLAIVAEQYRIDTSWLYKPLSALADDLLAREALTHALYVLKLRDVPFSQICAITGNSKGSVSRVTNEGGKDIAGRLASTRTHKTIHLQDQKMHEAILEKVADWEASLVVAEQEDYFEGDDTQEQETPLPAPTAQEPQKVENPFFTKVIKQEDKIIPLGNDSDSESDDYDNFGLPADDGVAEPDLPKNIGTQASPFENPTNASPVITANTNTANFYTKIASNILPVMVVPFTLINVVEVEALEEANRVPEGATSKVEKQNEVNQKKIKQDIAIQVDLVNEPLSRALGQAGVGSNPWLELAFALVVMVGMLAMSIMTMRLNNDALLASMKREHRKQQKMQEMKNQAHGNS